MTVTIYHELVHQGEMSSGFLEKHGTILLFRLIQITFFVSDPILCFSDA